MGELQKGAGDSTKSFDFFKSQIEKLTSQMVQLEKESAIWKEKSDVSFCIFKNYHFHQYAAFNSKNMKKQKYQMMFQRQIKMYRQFD